MKKAIKIIRNILIVLYAIIAIFVIICLLSYNDYKVSEFGSNSLLIIDNNKLAPEFNKGDLVIVNKDEDINIGDSAFIYNTYDSRVNISLAKVIGKEKITESEITYTLEGDKSLSSEYIIGTSKGVTKFGGVGTVLQILESKWGFLILVVFPSLVAFLYEIWEVVAQIAKSRKKADE